MTTFSERPKMAEFKKRFYEKNSNKSETHAGAMVKNNDREVADMPQDVHYKAWPKGGEYFDPYLDDTITGFDKQMDEDGMKMKKHLNPLKY